MLHLPLAGGRQLLSLTTATGETCLHVAAEDAHADMAALLAEPGGGAAPVCCAPRRDSAAASGM
jgi:hypothetical protein